MVAPSATVPLSSPIAVWWLPVLGVLLTGLGVVLLAASAGAGTLPALAARSTTSAMVAVETMPDRVAPTARVDDAAGSGVEDAVRAAPGRSGGPTNCLGADLATGRRPESAHLATVAVLRPADCGDLRDVIRGMATLPHTGHITDTDPPPIAVAAEPHPAEGIDLMAAALFGPPDHQPQAMLEEKALDGGRGRARDYLEETSATRLLVP